MIGDREGEDRVLARLLEAWPRLTAPEREEAAAAVQTIEARRRDHPLAYARLWDAPAPRTSQRRAVQAVLQPGIRNGWLLGGNRSGKSDARAQIVVAFALGRSAPDVQAWARWNGVDLAAIPDGPGEVWSNALDSGDSINYVRPKDEKYLPKGSRWHNREGQGEASVRLPGGGLIRYKTVDQGKDGFQGAGIRLCAFDEEPRDLGVVSEAEMRLVDQRGFLLLAMTPLYGWTPLLIANVRHPDPTTAVQWLHGEDNPHVPADELLARIGRTTGAEAEARRYGRITAFEGRIYAIDPSVHIVPAFRPPDHWPRYAGVDFGARNPTAALWAAYDADNDQIHVYAEHYAANLPISAHARAIKAAEAGHPEVMLRWADPEGRQQRIDLIGHGVSTAPARKDVRAGISAVQGRLALADDGTPGLLIHDCCRALIRESEAYCWRPDGVDAPVKRDDHACDALRYLVYGLERVLRSLEPG